MKRSVLLVLCLGGVFLISGPGGGVDARPPMSKPQIMERTPPDLVVTVAFAHLLFNLCGNAD